MVPARHCADLRHGLVGLVDEQQRVFGEVFEQRRRRLAGQAAGQEARVVLDPVAATGRGDHLEVEIGALLKPLVLEQLALRLQLLEPFGKLEFDGFGGLFHRRPGCDVVRVRIDAHLVQLGAGLAGQRIELDDLLDVVAEERNPPGSVFKVAGEEFKVVATHAEIAARESHIVALVLQRDELADQLALIDALAGLDVEDHRRIGLDRSDTVKAADRGDDDHVVPLQQSAGGRVAHPVDRLVHRAFLLDVGVAARHVGFGLVVVVVADEILDRVVGEEALELTIKLRGEDLVRRKDQRGPLQFLDHLGHGEGLA